MLKKLISIFIFATTSVAIFANHGPRIQFVNNMYSDSLVDLDIWCSLKNYPFGAFKVDSSLSNYKEATAFIQTSLIYGDVSFYVTSGGSLDTLGYLIKQTFGSPQIEYDKYYAIVLSENSTNNLKMTLAEMPLAGANLNSTGFTLFHGSYDAPTLNVEEITNTAGFSINNLAYQTSSNKTSIGSFNSVIQFQNVNGIAVTEFSVPFNFFPDRAVFLTLTGFLDTVGITPNIPLKLLIVQEDGSVLELFPEQSITPSYIQLIHNAADLMLNTFDVWLNDSLLIDNFVFRTATPILEVAGAKKITLAIKESNSSDPNNPLWSKEFILKSNDKHIMVASGIVSLTGYNSIKPFDVSIYNDALKEASSGQNTAILVHHGVTDAPAINISRVEKGSISIKQILSELTYASYGGYLDVLTNDYIYEIRNSLDNNSIGRYSVPLDSLKLSGRALTVLASGFLNPLVNSNGAMFGLWAALDLGGDLIELKPIISTTYVDDVAEYESSFALYPNPARNFINFSFKLQEESDVLINVYDLNGKVVKSILCENVDKANFNSRININELNQGLYQVHVSYGESTITRKIQVVK